MKMQPIYLNISKEEFEKQWNNSIKGGVIYKGHIKIKQNKNEANKLVNRKY